jgi:hypothetical protein
MLRLDKYIRWGRGPDPAVLAWAKEFQCYDSIGILGGEGGLTPPTFPYDA